MDRLAGRDNRILHGASAYATFPGCRKRRDHRLDDGLGGLGVLLQDRDYRLYRYILLCLMPDIVIGYQGQRRIADLSLPTELGLLQIGHPDDIDSPLPIDPRLRPGRKLRSLDTQVCAAMVYSRPYRPPGCEQQLAQGRTGRIGEAHMRDEAISEERADPPLCPIKKLIRNDDIQRRQILAHAADR